jgi:hypothetical protein
MHSALAGKFFQTICLASFCVAATLLRGRKHFLCMHACMRWHGVRCCCLGRLPGGSYWVLYCLGGCFFEEGTCSGTGRSGLSHHRMRSRNLAASAHTRAELLTEDTLWLCCGARFLQLSALCFKRKQVQQAGQYTDWELQRITHFTGQGGDEGSGEQECKASLASHSQLLILAPGRSFLVVAQ